jgi:hypothetical protein
MAKEILVDRYGRPVPQYFNPANDQYEYLYGSDGALHVKLVPYGAAIAAELSVSQRDIVARAIDDIIDTIGLENIACFLPMWENSGSELCDLIDPSLKFRVNGATPGVIGPFGSAWAFDGVNDYIEEAPAIETAVGTEEAALDSSTKMLAQRIKFRNPKRPIAFVRLRLKRVGSPVADLSVELREDSGGVPAATAVATSEQVMPAGSVATSLFDTGFAFNPAFSPRSDKTYWIVLKATNVTTLDDSNYVSWSYDSAGAYGEPRAVFNGAEWTARSGQSHAFKIYYEHLQVTEGTWIVAFKPLFVSPPLFSNVFSQTHTTSGLVARIFDVQLSNVNGLWRFRDRSASSITEIVFNREINLDRFVVAGYTFSAQASSNKLLVYWNGRVVAAASGTAGEASRAPTAPLTIGAIQTSSYLGAYFLGHIGGLIVARTPLTQQQIANVTRHVLALRRYKIGV